MARTWLDLEWWWLGWFCPALTREFLTLIRFNQSESTARTGIKSVAVLATLNYVTTIFFVNPIGTSTRTGGRDRESTTQAIFLAFNHRDPNADRLNQAKEQERVAPNPTLKIFFVNPIGTSTRTGGRDRESTTQAIFLAFNHRDPNADRLNQAKEQERVAPNPTLKVQRRNYITKLGKIR
ncbi:hypothetical protein C8R46DRAFT_1040246 [Mycena filopes]|nr:hypothetical protein C8R46DRAFT_1040246 [Mycena filopes]